MEKVYLSKGRLCCFLLWLTEQNKNITKNSDAFFSQMSFVGLGFIIGEINWFSSIANLIWYRVKKYVYEINAKNILQIYGGLYALSKWRFSSYL